ncbi:tyrosine-type recombinase/integrase [Hyphobacterium sp.]|uniref:tyrosine-type recombinase/integrase n=1 Tax=Hyphobacterium sp. TaxID=2004662 RepID=UPI003B51E713
MPLTDITIRSFKPADKPYKRSDGGGLYLFVSPSGGKLWRLAYRFDGKQKTLALGAYPAVSLALSRQRRDEAKTLLAAGVDPSVHAKAEKLARRASRENTFGAIAKDYITKVEKEGRADATMKKIRWMVDLANKDLGAVPIADISASDVLVPLRKLESEGKLETARRLRSVIGQVVRFAIASAKATHDPTQAIKGALTTPTVTHRAAATDRKKAASLFRAIWLYEGSFATRSALQLMALLYPRPGELRSAHWSEFDLDAKTWIIPAERAKMRREHRKPLSDAAVDILVELKRLNGSGELVFPSSSRFHRPMSENTMNMALRRLGFGKGEATAHGFRATASSLLNESGKWHPDAVEAELGHVGSDEVRRAYHRAAYWDERSKMTDWWANEIHHLRTAKQDAPDCDEENAD